MTTTLPEVAPRDRLPRTGWAGYAAAAFAACYGVNALLWTLAGGDGYPFGPNDPDERFALLRHVPVAVGAPLLAALLFAAAVLALAMSGPYAVRVQGAPRRLLLVAGWAIAAFLAVGVPTVTVFALTGYLPLLVLGAPFGWPPGIDYGAILDRSLLNQVICLVGGFLLARTVLEWQRRTRDACAACGRSGRAPRFDAARVGRWAVGAALVAPLFYAGIRYAWVLHVPLLITREHLDELLASGGQWIGAGLGTFAVVGSLLTLGLVQRWGEVFPGWIPVLHGRPVPVRLAVLPALYVATVTLAGTLGPVLSPDFWHLHPVEALPVALMPAWAVALAVAAVAYRVRRHVPCEDCGRSA